MKLQNAVVLFVAVFIVGYLIGAILTKLVLIGVTP